MLPSQDLSAAAALRMLYRQLSRTRRRALWVLLLAMIAGAGAEMLTLGAVLAFLQAAANPQGDRLLAQVLGRGCWRSLPSLPGRCACS
jgi:ATP-binding cassette, subfamily B, bacterial PglK